MKNLGQLLKNARENKDYTQKEVMQLTGINSKSLSGYENDVAEPDLQTLSELARLYEISLDEILEIKPTETCILTKSEKQILRLFHSLSPEEQKKWIDMMVFFISYSNADKEK